MKVSLLVRSYNRPEYLKKTLESILSSDIDICIERIIYDDGSNDPGVKDILQDEKYIKREKKEFKVICSQTNDGCKFSYLKALSHVSNDADFICTIDNDVIVKPDFIARLKDAYIEGFKIYKTFNILLTGFNPNNVHLNRIETHENIYRKKSCGAVNFFFCVKFKQYVIDKWRVNLDWGVVHSMFRDNYPLICLNKGVVNHIGVHGLWSNALRYDKDDDFNLDT